MENFQKVDEEIRDFEPDLILMDIGLPFFNGFHWCEEIRKFSNAPILILSSASDNMSQIMAMNMGADDYLTKPFDLNLLLAKVQAMLRRAYGYEPMEHLPGYEGLLLHSGKLLFSYGEEEVSLTKNEFSILSLLVQRREQVLPRDDIIRALWADEHFIDDNTLTVNINRLRKKLETAGIETWLQTRKGIGYILVKPS